MHWRKQCNWIQVSLRIASVATGIRPRTSFADLLSNQKIRFDYSNLILFTWPMHWMIRLINSGNEEEWQAEWKWDGIRGQLIKAKQ